MKKILTGEETHNLAPFEYPWAYTMALNSLSNHWHPQEIPLSTDKATHDLGLSIQERHLFRHVFATLTTADLAIAGNLTERLYGVVKAAEIRLYIARQIAEEALHSISYQHILETLGVDQDDTYTLYQRVPQIADWFNFMADATRLHIAGRHITLPLMAQYAIWEGVFFMTGFSPIFALARNGKMTGTAEQLQYIMRDETMHVAFGLRLINEIHAELGHRPEINAVHALFHDAIIFLDRWADYCIPPILGYNADTHKAHARYLVNRRLRTLDYPELYPGAMNAIPWLDEMASIRKEKNFFESKVTEYQSAGALRFDDDPDDQWPLGGLND